MSVYSRPTEGFKPQEHLLRVRYEDSEKEEYVLPFVAKRAWADAYCKEQDIQMRLEEHDVSFVPDQSLVMVIARLFFDDVLMATGVAAKPIDASTLPMVVQNTATKAKSRALSNAGFDVSTREEDEDLTPAESGMLIVAPDGTTIQKSQLDDPNYDPLSMPPIPASTNFAASAPAAPKSAPVSTAPANTPDAPVDTPPATDESPAPAVPTPPVQVQSSGTGNGEMTLAEAQAFIIPVGGFKGKTVGMVAAEKLDRIRWFAQSYDKNPQLSEACRIVYNHVTDSAQK